MISTFKKFFKERNNKRRKRSRQPQLVMSPRKVREE